MSKYVGKIITNQAPAGYSVFFNGSSKLRTTSFTPVNAGQDFTVEAWAYQTTQTPGGLQCIATPRVSGGSWYFGIYLNNIFLYDEGVGVFSGSAVTPNTWQHLAYSRQGTTHRLFINGVLVATTTAIAQAETGAALAIGADTSNSDDLGSPYYGYLSNLRVVIGTALYTASFTPPTQLFPVTNTQILTFQNPAIQDNSTNNRTFISIGTPTVSTFTPFAAYNPAPTSANPLIPAPGVWTLDEALQYTQQGVWPSPAANAIEDVFSTYLYTGNGQTQTINNGIDLAGKGGLVWIKSRSAGFLSHVLTDTVRGNTKVVYSNLTAAQDTFTDGITSFNSNGFSLGVNSNFNESTYTFASWTFREQAKFFDVVTYTGTGPGTGANEQQVSHNLGSKPGAIIIKRTDSTGDWWFFTDVIDGSNDFGYLNKTDAFGNSGNNVPTSTVFNVGGVLNTSGATYVAYLFAHNAGGFGPAGTDNVISCGSFTTDGSGNINSGSGVSLGYEPQFIIAKRTDSSTAGSWNMIDNIRGWLATPATTSKYLFANSAGAEGDFGAVFQPTATGFSGVMGGTSATYIYIAIRRGPMRPPSSGTSVFYPLAIAQAISLNTSTVPFPPDLINTFSRNGTDRSSTFNLFQVLDRLRGLGAPSTSYVGGSSQLISSSTASENNTVNAAYVNLLADSQNITRTTGWGNPSYGDWINYFWRRAPGFFDVVCYTGTGVTDRVVAHNLTIPPELIITKNRSISQPWAVGTSFTSTGYRWMYLNLTDAAFNLQYSAKSRINSQPTSTQYVIATDSEINGSGNNYVAYLFATVGGVSKVGSYTGTGTTQQINCGFTNGSRFVMIKRTDSTGAWYVWDSARGIVAGNDPYLLLNSTAAEVTNTDYVDTYSLGFELSSTAPADLNASGGTYIFLAIA